MTRLKATATLLLALILTLASPAEALRRRAVSNEPVGDLVGKWESPDRMTYFELAEGGADSLIRIQNEATTTFYPISWSSDGKKLEITYTAVPYQETIDPFYEAFWRPSMPRQPEPMSYSFSRDGKQLSLGKNLTLIRYRG